MRSFDEKTLAFTTLVFVLSMFMIAGMTRGAQPQSPLPAASNTTTATAADRQEGPHATCKKVEADLVRLQDLYDQGKLTSPDLQKKYQVAWACSYNDALVELFATGGVDPQDLGFANQEAYFAFLSEVLKQSKAAKTPTNEQRAEMALYVRLLKDAAIYGHDPTFAFGKIEQNLELWHLPIKAFGMTWEQVNSDFNKAAAFCGIHLKGCSNAALRNSDAVATHVTP